MATVSACTDIRWLIVLATGRSGSTTVTDMLNALPAVSVHGEMSGTVGLSIDMLDAARTGREVKAGPWHSSNVSRQALNCQLEQWFATLCRPDWREKRGEYTGFKDLFSGLSRRSYQPHPSTVWMPFLERVFPSARFVLNTRDDTAAQSSSGFWRKPTTKGWQAQRLPSNVTAQELLDDATSELREWGHRLGPNRCFWLPLSPTGFTVEQFNGLARWLGVPCTFLSVAHANSNNTYRSEHTSPIISCR